MEKQLICAKFGSETTTSATGVDLVRIESHVEQLTGLLDEYNLITTVSGAVKAGRAIWEMMGKEPATNDQVMAMVGSAPLFMGVRDAFARRGVIAGQLQATHHEIDDGEEGQTLKTALESSLDLDVVTVTNQNDALARFELDLLAYGGENDGLNLHIARLMRADVVIKFTDEIGLLEGKGGSLVRRVAFDDAGHNFARSCVYDNGKGTDQGMFRGVETSIQAARYGMRAIIAHADSNYAEVLAGEDGTHFEPYVR